MNTSLASVNQSATPKLYTELLYARCDEKETFEFGPHSQMKIGHLLNLTVSTSDTKLVRDTCVCNPENPNDTVDIAGAVIYAGWEDNDVLSLSFRLSPQNKALLHEVLCTSPEGLEIGVELVVYEYDYHARKYFRRFHMQKPVMFEIMGRVSIDDEPDRIIRKPIGFRFNMSLKASGNVQDQEIFFAMSATGKTHKRILNPK
jgi:hypothetical protein